MGFLRCIVYSRRGGLGPEPHRKDLILGRRRLGAGYAKALVLLLMAGTIACDAIAIY
jgi:hypothetical protein